MMFQVNPDYFRIGTVFFLIGAAVLVLLFFLKASPREIQLPSVMLWHDVSVITLPRKLGRLFRRFFHWLVLLLAMALLTGAAMQLRPARENAAPSVVVTEPGALPEALKFYRRLPGDARQLLIASARPVSGNLSSTYRRFGGPVNRSEALALAASGDGKVYYFGSTAPPWLPAQGIWIRKGNQTAGQGIPPLKIWGAPGAVVSCPLWTEAASPEEADLIAGPQLSAGGILELTRTLQGEYSDGLQHLEIAPAAVPDQRPHFVLEDLLWLLGFFLIAGELIFWLRGKVI